MDQPAPLSSSEVTSPSSASAARGSGTEDDRPEADNMVAGGWKELLNDGMHRLEAVRLGGVVVKRGTEVGMCG